MGPEIELRGLALRGPLGIIYGPLDADIASGTFTQIVGCAGSGRSCLLLTLAGRLRGYTGQGTLDGRPLRSRAARQRVAVARLADAIYSDAHLRIGRLVGPISRHLDEAWELTGIAPEPDTRLGDLTPADRLLTELALSIGSGADAIVVDDTGAGLTPEGTERVGAALARVAGSGRTVVATATSADPRAEVVIELPERAGSRS